MGSHQNTEFVNSVVMIILNIVLNLILIPSFGVIGAAFAFLFTIVVMSVVRTIELRIFFSFVTFNSRYLKLLAYVIFLVAIGFLTLISSSIIFKLTIAIFILSLFILLIYKFRSEEDIAIWNSLRSKLASYGFMNQ